MDEQRPSLGIQDSERHELLVGCTQPLGPRAETDILRKRQIATQIALDRPLQHPPLSGQLVEMETLEAALRFTVSDVEEEQERQAGDERHGDSVEHSPT
ncbi:MAG: hypothetical protein N3D77_07495 [Geminicoccaceae bacterium]|nr:hypothetical protein [Geminicoccaceae bacterium]